MQRCPEPGLAPGASGQTPRSQAPPTCGHAGAAKGPRGRAAARRSATHGGSSTISNENEEAERFWEAEQLWWEIEEQDRRELERWLESGDPTLSGRAGGQLHARSAANATRDAISPSPFQNRARTGDTSYARASPRRCMNAMLAEEKIRKWKVVVCRRRTETAPNIRTGTTKCVIPVAATMQQAGSRSDCELYSAGDSQGKIDK